MKNRQFSHLLTSGLFMLSLVVLNGYLCLPPAKGHSTHRHCKLCWPAVSNFLRANTDLVSPPTRISPGIKISATEVDVPTCMAGEEENVRTAENLFCVCFGDIPCSFELDIENYSLHFSFSSLPFSTFFCLFYFSVYI